MQILQHSGVSAMQSRIKILKSFEKSRLTINLYGIPYTLSVAGLNIGLYQCEHLSF